MVLTAMRHWNGQTSSRQEMPAPEVRRRSEKNCRRRSSTHPPPTSRDPALMAAEAHSFPPASNTPHPPRLLAMPCHKRTRATSATAPQRSEEHTSELQSQSNLVCRLL